MTTFICGYWNINNNVKHSYNKHYKNLIPKTFSILKDCNIVFFYDDNEVLSDIKKNIQTNNIIYKKISIDSLETYNLSNDYLETCKLQDNNSLRKINRINSNLRKPLRISETNGEKGLIHYQREYKQSGEDSFRKVFTVWTSKLFLVNKTIDENPFNTNYFAWIDISAARHKQNNKYYTQNYNTGLIYHFNSTMKCYNKKIPINAHFLIAHKTIWKKLIPLYEKQLQLSKNSRYAHDEETILYLIWKDNKDLFCDIHKQKLNTKINYFDNIPHILYINLDRALDRNNYIENLFKQHNIHNFTRISAYDGNKHNFYYPSKISRVSSNEYGCICSHLKALEYFVNNINEELCIICEDDISFEYTRYWNKTFNDYIKDAPADWDLLILQIITNKINIKLNHTKYQFLDVHGTGFYIVKKETAKYILSLVKKNNHKYNFQNSDRYDIIADKLIYKYIKNIYYFPLITTLCEDSYIHNNHIQKQKQSKNNLLNLWIKN